MVKPFSQKNGPGIQSPAIVTLDELLAPDNADLG